MLQNIIDIFFAVYFGNYLKKYASYKNIMHLVGKLKASAFHTCKFDFGVTSTSGEKRLESCRTFLMQQSL